MFVCLSEGNSDAWSHLNKVAGSLTADGVDLTVDDGDDLRQRQTDSRQTENAQTHVQNKAKHKQSAAANKQLDLMRISTVKRCDC